MKRFAVALAIAVAVAVTPIRVLAASAVQRPISDFLSQQGTTMVFNAPVPDEIGWANAAPSSLFAWFDYNGTAAAYLAGFGIDLGTTTSGKVTERPLADGRAEVQVILDTKNALTWAADPNPDPNTDPPSFGYRPAELVADPSLVAALGESHLQVLFTNTAVGAPLPDLVDAFILGNAGPGQELLFITFRGNANGPLRAEAGLGPEGTPGKCIVTETGTLSRGNVADGFPAEIVNLRRIGH